VHSVAHGVGWTHLLLANFLELRQGEVRLSPGPIGEHFSGSCTVTSRNSLIHNGATNGTKSGSFDPKGEQQGLLSRVCRCVEEPFATANFREFVFSEVRCPQATPKQWQIYAIWTIRQLLQPVILGPVVQRGETRSHLINRREQIEPTRQALRGRLLAFSRV
jgi:hypothetical protein